jgi:hypothetical protein
MFWLDWLDQALDKARSRLDDSQADEAWEHGYDLGLHTAVQRLSIQVQPNSRDPR